MWSMLNKAGSVGQTVLSVTDRYFEPTADIILRVPSLVLLDYCWQFELDRTLLWATDAGDKYGVFNTIIAISLFLQALAVLLLPLEYVVRLYMHYISAAILVLANQFSYYHVTSEAAQPAGPGLAAFFQTVPVWRIWGAEGAPLAAEQGPQVEFLRRQLAAVAVHLSAAAAVVVLLEVEDTRRRVSLLAHAVPVVALMANMASGAELVTLHNCAGAVTILSCLTWLLGCAPACIDYYQQLYLKYYFHATQVYGATGTARHLFWSLFAPRLQLAYWLCLVLTQVHHYVYVPRSQPTARGEWYMVLLSAVASTTASPISLTGFCVAVAYGSWAAVRLLRALLPGRAAADGAAGHSGWLEAATVLALALQVDLIHLRMPARLAVMLVVLFVASTSTAQAVYDVTEEAVLALSASGSRRPGRHARVLLVCALLAALPVYLTVLLCELFERDFWILVVASSALTLSVQAVGLLTVYAVFLYDALRCEPWRHLDDVVYWTRSAAGGAQFVVAVLVVAAGVWESARGRWSWANAAVLLAHCYFNVWRRLRAGWTQFALRRAAARTACRLPEAAPELLRRHGDVCAICYCAMSEARCLPCRHMFHAACLRKWLYVQLKCPLCQAEIVAPEPEQGRGRKQEQEQEQEKDQDQEQVHQQEREQERDTGPQAGVDAPAAGGQGVSDSRRGAVAEATPAVRGTKAAGADAAGGNENSVQENSAQEDEASGGDGAAVAERRAVGARLPGLDGAGRGAETLGRWGIDSAAGRVLDDLAGALQGEVRGAAGENSGTACQPGKAGSGEVSARVRQRSRPGGGEHV